MSLTSLVAPSPAFESVAALVGERLSVSALHQLGGTLGGYSFVKVVVDREQAKIHFLNNARHSFHAIYIGEEILGVPGERDARRSTRTTKPSTTHPAGGSCSAFSRCTRSCFRWKRSRSTRCRPS